MPTRTYHVIFNANAGTALATGITEAALAEMFASNGLAATIDADADRPMPERIEQALASDADTIVAAGGDGTITALCGAILGTGKSLAILPPGTVNALAKDLHIPLDTAAAVAALADGVTQQIDVGEVNGRFFLHKVVIGMIPGMAAGHEHIRGMPGVSAKVGFMRYFFRRLARTRRIAIAIDADDTGKPEVERVQAVAVASNSYDEGFGRILARERLDGGTLTLYVLKRLTFVDFFRPAGGMLVGRWHQDQALEVQSVGAVTIDSHKGLLKVMFDGEVETLATPLHFTIHPKALTMLAPAPLPDTGNPAGEALPA
ncbi:diacylglycerol kinase family protein [Devosia sp. A8/3-2]|nr:diacylglycerol kinase family protein [Devosia sp. A8/3-2]